MRPACSSAGLTSVVLAVSTLLSLSFAWPRRHTHRSHNHALSTSSEDSGSALIIRPVVDNSTNDRLYLYFLKHREIASTNILSVSSQTPVISTGLNPETSSEQLNRVLILNPHQRVHFYESSGASSTRVSATQALQISSRDLSVWPDHTQPAAPKAGIYGRAAIPDYNGGNVQGGEKTHHHSHRKPTTTVSDTSTTEVFLSLTPSSVISGPSVLVDASSPSSIPSIPNPVSLMLCKSESTSVTYETSGKSSYEIVCNTDFPGNDLALIHTDSYQACMESCDAFNKQYSTDESCLGISYVPSWINGANNCFLKSVTGNDTSQPWHVDSAILISGSLPSSSAQSSSLSYPSASAPVQSVVAAALPAPSSLPPLPFQAPSVSPTGAVSSLLSTATLSSAAVSSDSAGFPSIIYASGSSVIAPRMVASNLHGISSNDPTEQYIKWSNPPNLKLSSNLLTKNINGDLSTKYGHSLDTGVLEVNETTKALLSDLKNKPHLSRDGGKGGYLDGHKVFLFCDTGSYTPPSGDKHGNFLGFVSSSAAIDKGMNAASGRSLTLQDGIGQWSDDVGRMRGFSPMTSGEQSYNLAMQGNGQRYAIWPESSILPFNRTHALLYAPIIFDDVNMTTKAAKFTYTGTTLLVLSIPGDGGPLALRLVDKLFEQNEVEWGTIGGFRSYGSSGIGGNDGKVYIFGNVQGGLLAARVDARKITDRNSYEYWNGASWDGGMQSLSSQAHFIKGAFMDGDIFYSPRHLTFIFVYLNPYADNTFYYRYLQADTALLPPSAPGGEKLGDFAEAMFKYKWSSEKILYQAPPGTLGKYIYAGGVHQGYFDEDDVTNGGKKMLLSWTLPTGSDPSAMDSEYNHITADIEWD